MVGAQDHFVLVCPGEQPLCPGVTVGMFGGGLLNRFVFTVSVFPRAGGDGEQIPPNEGLGKRLVLHPVAGFS